MDQNKVVTRIKLKSCEKFPYAIGPSFLLIGVRFENFKEYKTRYTRDSVILSRAVLDEYTEDEIITMFIHTALAIILGHPRRFKQFTVDNERNRYLWGIASEIARSDFLLAHNFTLPQGVFLDSSMLAFPDGNPFPHKESVEVYYDLLCRLTNNLEHGGSEFASPEPTTEDHNNSSSISSSVSQDRENVEAVEAEESTRKTQASGINSDSSDIIKDDSNIEGEFIEDIGEASEIQQHLEAIKNMLKGAVSRGIAHTLGEFKHYRAIFYPEQNNIISRLRNLLVALADGGPSKQRVILRPRKKCVDPNVALLQFKRRGYNRIAAIVDVSGSLCDSRQEVFNAIALAVNATKNIDVFIGDTAILEIKKKVKNINQLIGLPEGGGTDMANIMMELDKKGYYHSLVVITDAMTPWPSEPTRARAFAFLVGEYYYAKKEVPAWITIV